MDTRSPIAFDEAAMPNRNPRDAFAGLFLPSEAVDEAQTRVMAEITALGLERNAWELDALGYTVLAPEQTGAGDLVPRMRAHLMSLFDAQAGRSLGLETDDGFAVASTPVGRGMIVPLPLLYDSMYEQALLNHC